MGANKQRNTRLIKRNVRYYLEQELTVQGYGAVKIFDAFPDTNRNDFLDDLPAVSIGIFGNEEGEIYELGTEEENYGRPVVIDIFTIPRLDGQCDDLKDLIKDLFKKDTRFEFYDFNTATPHVITNKFKAEDTRATILGTPPDVYNQGVVTFTAIIAE